MTWEDVEQRALFDPFLHAATTQVRGGHVTREQALIAACLALSTALENTKRDYLAVLEARLPSSLLREIEWSGDPHAFACPSCKRSKMAGHETWCKLAAILEG